jgi:hypothetical protein
MARQNIREELVGQGNQFLLEEMRFEINSGFRRLPSPERVFDHRNWVTNLFVFAAFTGIYGRYYHAAFGRAKNAGVIVLSVSDWRLHR